jgi:predicted  nucleic acid-binding Zn-ribbon protein
MRKADPVCFQFTLPLVIAVSFLLLVTSGCQTAYYAAMEKVGVYKRDLLKKRVAAARDEQKEAGAQFQDALTRLKAMYQFDGGELERAYRQLEADFKQSETRAKAVRQRIADMERVAGDLFTEWEAEIAQISTPSLQTASRSQLTQTRARYDSMRAALDKASQGMDPVLTQFRDHVLFLKHNLNAQAIASLKGEAGGIQTEIARLIAEMNTSIAKADEFIKTLN